MPPFYIAAAFLSDLLIGDPRRMPHPVRTIGGAVGALDGLMNRPGPGPKARVALGGALVLIVTLSAYAITYLLISLARRYFGAIGGGAVTVYLAYTTISVKGLSSAARDVLAPLERQDLPGARGALSMVVGRDTAGLDEQGVVRGAVETVSENASDGIVAPLLYLALGGAPLAMAYKAVNTMDSMLGYKNERYLHFGMVAARLDDLANFLPARLTGVLMALAAFILSRLPGGFSYSAGGSWETLARDRYKHDSPNSGWPEAAAAGALSVRLGGENSYFGEVKVKPFIGEPLEPLAPGKIRDAVRLMRVTATLALGVAMAIAYVRT